MASPGLLLALILAAAFVAMLSNRVRPDVVALCVALALGLTGVVSPAAVFAGFSRGAVITLIGLFILTQGLYRTGVTQVIGSWLARASRGGERRLTALTMISGAFLSLFMNNIAAAAMLLPATVHAAKRARVAPSKVMMPLAFATALGGMATLLTTANIVVSATLRDRGLNGFGLFDFAPVGVPLTVAGIAYLLWIGRRLLPDRSVVQWLADPERRQRELAESYSLHERLHRVTIPRGSALCDVSLEHAGIGARLGLSVLAILRGGRLILSPRSREVLHPDDVLIVGGRAERVDQLAADGALIEPATDAEADLVIGEGALVEVILAPRSRAVGQTLKQLRFRQKYGATVVALWHEGRSWRTDQADVPLAFGDSMLVYGTVTSFALLQVDPDFLVLRFDAGATDVQRKRAGLALGIMLVTLVVGAIELMPIAQAMMLGAIAMVLAGCVDIDDAYRSIEWRAIFLIAGMLPVSVAMADTGMADGIGRILTSGLQAAGPVAVAGGLLTATAALSQVMSGQVTAVVMAPVAISAAQAIGADPRAMAMVVALGCSLVFLLPTAHPVNVFVMGAGGYKASDYPRVGAGLTAVCMMIILAYAALMFRG